MSMEERKVPELRFKGFHDDWEQRKIKDISEVRTGPFGSVLHARDYIDDGIPIITTEHFKSGNLPKEKTDIPQVSNEDYLRLQSYVLQIGDIVFSRVGSIDKNALVTASQEGWLFSGRVLRARPFEGIQSYFLSYLLDTTNVKRSIISRAVGQTMPSINTEILKKTKIKITTNRKEQLKIGEIINKLDISITLHQRKIQILEKIKRCFLQEMLASKEQHHPTLRFSAFEDSWRNYKLKDIILNEFKGKATASMNGTKSIYLDTNYLNGGKVSYVDSTSNIDKDDVIILWDGSQAGTVYHGFKGALGSTLKAFKPMYSGSFLYLQLLKNQNRIYHSYRTPNIPHVIKSFSEEFLIPMGSQNEQNKISSFFKIIEYEIKLKKEKLDTLMKIKEVYLQKLFI